MRRWMMGLALATVGLAGCTTTDEILVPGDVPDAPQALDVRYYNRSVVVTWELGPRWNGEPFRVYSRVVGGRWLVIAEVTSCSAGLCSYSDSNIESGASYDYYVAAVGYDGVEVSTAESLRITIPSYAAPPVPGGMEVVALDGANYLRWDSAARAASDFSFYRVYLWYDDQSYLLGETDSQGFLDELAENGLTYRYFVSAVDEYGHESLGSALGVGTPRPDYHGEILYDFFARPEVSGFIFREDDGTDPIVSGTDPFRHVRLETDAQGWWLVPGPGVAIYPLGYETTALRCGPGSDAGCVALDEAPTTGYQAADVGLLAQTTYVLRVPGEDNLLHYAALRVEMLGYDEFGDPLMIFDWAHQLQPGNPALAPVTGISTRIR